MGLLRWLGFGKKEGPEEGSEPPGQTASEVNTGQSDDMDIVVYSPSDATRWASVRDLLERNNYPFRDVRVDDDMSTKGWLQRTTGDGRVPKVFIGAKCYGGFEDIQAMAMDGTFQSAVDGTMDDSGDEEIEQLKETMTREAIAELLKRGEILTIDEGGLEMDVWAEPFAKPPVVYYEGAPEPLEEVEAIASRILDRVKSGEIEIVWKDED